MIILARTQREMTNVKVENLHSLWFFYVLCGIGPFPMPEGEM